MQVAMFNWHDCEQLPGKELIKAEDCRPYKYLMRNDHTIACREILL